MSENTALFVLFGSRDADATLQSAVAELLFSRKRTVSTALQAYALFAGNASKGAVRVLPE